MKEISTRNGWKTNIIHWNKLTQEMANLYISQAESRLQGTIETHEKLSKRTEVLIGVCTTLISTSIGYIFTGADEYLRTLSFFVIPFLLPITYYLLKNWKTYDIATLGEEPRIIFTSKFVDNDLSDNDKTMNLVFQIMETIQFKTDTNKEVNISKLNNIVIAKRIFIFFPILILIATFYHRLFGYHLPW